ncbi:MAG: sulfatase-like hydrolase/transferase [Gammaproteobacteria bacterium]|nr:sulfatase-like hydrolase/transferase [Gammaproteobacteria bacterium]
MAPITWLLLLLAGASAAAAPQPTNLLFILTDNQPAAILGAYGNPDVRTPHIDRLADEGMRFKHAFAVNGMCSPTRATLMTGLMPSQHGVHNWLDDEMLDTWPRDWSAVAEFRTLPLTLRNRGYQTALIGKWHLGQPWKASLGYEHWVTFTYGHTLDFWDNTIIENGKTYPVTGQHSVDFFAEKAVEYLQNYAGTRPFYLQLNFNGPYLNPPTNLGPARNRHYASYTESDFSSFPRVAFNDNVLEQLLDPRTNEFLRKKHRQAIAMHNDPATMANVASQNTLVDDGVGRVLAALHARGLDKNTLVVFSSDQGNFYGQHGLWQHTVVTSPSNLYEAALNIPLILRQPGTIAAGSESSLLVGQYDLPVTLLDYLGIRDVTLESSPGRSFRSALIGKSLDWKNEVFYEQEESRGIRTPRFAYWERLAGTGQSELYDMEIDPRQQNNMIAEPAYQATVAELSGRLGRFFHQYVNSRYDLWQGGTAKGSVIRPKIFKQLYGSQWAPEAESLPAFSEE